MVRSVEEEIFMDGVRRLAAGQVTHKFLAFALKVDVFAKLKGRSATLEELAAALSLPVASTRTLGQFLCREGLLQLRDGRLSNVPVVESLLADNSLDRQGIDRFIQFDLPYEALSGRLLDPPPLHWYQLRESGDITDNSAIVGQQQEGWLSRFLSNLNVWRVRWGEELASHYDFSRHRLLLDVGGASGGWCIGIRKTHPELACIVFDVPQARATAEQIIRDANEAGSIRFVEGSFFADELPAGADVALLANIVHNWTLEDGHQLLARVLRALEPGGVLLVKETYFEDDWTGPAEAVFESFLMLGKEGKGGWQPSYGEMEEMLRQAGCVDLERRFGLVIGRKPA